MAKKRKDFEEVFMKQHDIYLAAVFGLVMGFWVTHNYHAKQQKIRSGEIKNIGGYEQPVNIHPIIFEVEQRDVIPPIKNYRITSGQGIRKSPITGKNSLHYGVDLSVKKYNGQKTPVIACSDGIVVLHYPPPDRIYKGHDIYGGYIEIKHDSAISRYGHLEKTFVHEGDRIKQGQIIGIMGDTGLSFGKHLHFEYLEAIPWEVEQ